MSAVEQVVAWSHVRITATQTIMGRDHVHIVALPPTSDLVTHRSMADVNAMMDASAESHRAQMDALAQAHALELTAERERIIVAEQRIADMEVQLSSTLGEFEHEAEARRAAETQLATLKVAHTNYKKQANIDRRNYENRLELLQVARQEDRAEKGRLRRHVATLKAEKDALGARYERTIADMRSSRARRAVKRGATASSTPSGQAPP